ncbi:MAG: DnaJ domain-containing protein [Desulfobacteraceae bacterium]|jgi:DnaJ-class molecular chaperone
MKDYYKILGLSSDATEEQIRKAYRRLALKYHPDRNPGDPQAGERFTEIAEAYGVLIDPVKRREYARWQSAGPQERMAGGGFRYSQEEIFQDLFRDSRFNQIFQELLREFQRAGIRSDRRFLNQVFFGGRGFVFGGVFFFGPFRSGRMKMGGPRQRTGVEGYATPQTKPPKVLKWLAEKIGGYLSGEKSTLPDTVQETSGRAEDLVYRLTVSQKEAKRGTWVKIAVNRGEGKETLKVRIPPDTKPGSRLRLRGKGMGCGQEEGDLYLLMDLS